MPNEKHKCPISQEELIHDNINDFILVKVSNTEIERATHAHYFIHSSIQNVFFGLEKCPLTRATEEYQALYLKDLSAKLKIQVLGLTDSTEFNLFLANKELQNHIKTGSFTFKETAINPTTTIDEFKNLITSYPLQIDAIMNTMNNATLLHYFAQDNKTEFVTALIDKGADKEAKDNNGKTPLHWAAIQGHTATALALITAGADIEAKGNHDWTPLHLASIEGHTEIV
ncbi:MAG: ankyrin repeat domain-containing protein, partial [Legionellales bacterium]|nr:ankyrin repeat domain-containing protein [Legionellales bacterium]